MKIGFFTDSYLPMFDGVATSVESYARALEQLGHEVYIIAPRYPRYKDKKKNVYRLTSIKIVKTPEIRWALQLPEKSLIQILQIDFDIIHGHSGGGVTFLGLQIARAKNIPYVGTYHTLWNRYAHYIFNGMVIRPRMLELTSKFVGNLCDHLIAPTGKVKKELVAYGIKKPIMVFPSGIDLENYTSPRKGYLRKKLKLQKDIRILLYVGRLGKEKSVDFLVHSFKQIHQQQPDTVLVLVGGGAEKNNLLKLAKELGIEKFVYICGPIRHADIPKVYTDANLFLFASETETQGMVILEALASKLPVIAVKDEAFKNVILEGENGYLVEKDTTEFAKRVVSVLKSQKLYDKLSLTAEQSVSKYSVQTTVTSLEKLYEKLIIEKAKTSKRRNIKVTVGQFKNYIIQARTQLMSYLETS